MAVKTPLELVLEKTQMEEKTMAERLEKAQQLIRQEQQQLEQLEDYRAEYVQKIQQQQPDWSASKISHYRSFLQQLTHAAKAQQDKIAIAESSTAQLRQQLMVYRHKMSVLSELIEEQRRNQQQLQDKMLQKELDELALRMGNRF